MPEQEGSLLQIWNALFAGETLALSLSTLDLPSFRTALFRFKKKQEEILLDMDMLEEGGLKKLILLYDADREVATISLAARPKNKTYTILKVVKSISDAQESS